MQRGCDAAAIDVKGCPRIRPEQVLDQRRFRGVDTHRNSIRVVRLESNDARRASPLHRRGHVGIAGGENLALGDRQEISERARLTAQLNANVPAYGALCADRGRRHGRHAREGMHASLGPQIRGGRVIGKWCLGNEEPEIGETILTAVRPAPDANRADGLGIAQIDFQPCVKIVAGMGDSAPRVVDSVRLSVHCTGSRSVSCAALSRWLAYREVGSLLFHRGTGRHHAKPAVI